MQEMQVQMLVGELKFHMLCGQKKKKNVLFCYFAGELV